MLDQSKELFKRGCKGVLVVNVNTKYLYPFNAERYKNIYERELPCKKSLNLFEYENAYILPAKNEEGLLFGRGGIVDKNGIYVEESGIVSQGRFLHPDGVDSVVNVFGGKYEFDSADANNIDDPVVYLGFVTNHWGHFLMDFTTRLWFFLEHGDKWNGKYVFVVKEGQNFQLINNICRFLSLLGLDLNNLLFVNEVTRFSKIIVPEVSYITNKYYTQEFLEIFDTVASRAKIDSVEVTDKVYLSRASWYKAKSSEVGEELLLDILRSNGFKIISPENYTLDEQIGIIRKSKIVAGITGTITHNMLFARNEQRLLIFNKTYNFNSMQKDINYIRNLLVDYVDAYVSVLPVPLGDGPFAIVYSNELKRYIMDCEWSKPKLELVRKQSENVKKFVQLCRQSLANDRIDLNYISDKNNSAYFDPAHLTMYFADFYLGVEPIKKREVLRGKLNQLVALVRKIKSRIKEKIN